MIIAACKTTTRQAWALRHDNGLPWLVAYAATLLIPLMLIYSRGAADGMCILIGVLFLVHSYRQKNWQWLNEEFLRIAFFAWAWLLLIVSPFAYNGMDSYGVAGPWIRYVLLYAALRHWVLVRREALLFLACTLAFMLSLTAVDALWQYVTGVSLSGHIRGEDNRLTGPMKSVKVGIFMAKLLLPTTGLCLFFSLQSRKKIFIFSSLGLLAACLLTILLSGERTAFISSTLSITVILIIVALHERKWRTACLSAIGLAIIAVVILYYTQPYLQRRLQFLHENMTQFDNSAYLQLFWTGFELGKHHWLTGVGLKSFRVLCLDYEPLGITHCNLHPHNPYVEWFAEAGLAGLMLFLMMIASLALAGLKLFRARSGIERIIPVFALGTVLMHFFPFLGTQSFFSNWPAILLWYSLSVAYASLNVVEREQPPISASTRY